MFIRPGLEERVLVAAVRFSEFACVGRGHKTSVHGGAVESCLDEATAELAKTKLFPLATTYSIEFKIAKPVQPNVTYRVHCEVLKEGITDIKYDVVGRLTSTDEREEFAKCTAVMVNSFAMSEQAAAVAKAGGGAVALS